MKYPVFFFFLLVNLSLTAGIVEHLYSFDTETIRFARSTDGYDIVYLDNTLNTAPAGEPALPFSSVSLLLPPGEKAETVELIPIKKVLIDGKFNIRPQQFSRPVSSSGPYDFYKNEEIYKRSLLYPYEKLGKVTTEYLNGHSFGMTTFTPAEYNPATGSLWIYSLVTVRINTSVSKESKDALDNLYGSEQISVKIRDFDDNNGKLLAMYPVQSSDKPDEGYDYLIITIDDFKRYFDPLADFYNNRGFKSKIVSLTEILSVSTGADNCEKIRNFIITEYRQKRIGTVLLGGDSDIIPYRGFFCTFQSSSLYSDSGIPSALYFSSLDGTWNDDGDDLWGEKDEDDLLPDISVARLPYSSVGELQNMIKKSISYQSFPVVEEVEKTLMAGEGLYNNPLTWGGDYLDMLIGYKDDHGYITSGIPEDQIIMKLYDNYSSWDKTKLISEINEGYSFIRHEGHSNYGYNMRMTNDDVTSENFDSVDGVRHNFPIIYSSGCMSGGFDFDCIGEKYISIDRFASAFIGNSRYGWFNEGTTEGPSIHIHREFCDALYGSGTTKLGSAHKESRIDTSPWVNAPGQWEEGALRWCFYDCNVLGDPAMNVWTASPVKPIAEFNKFISHSQEYLQVRIFRPDGTSAENVFCAIVQNGDPAGGDFTGPDGTAQIPVDPLILPGFAELSVSGSNILPQYYRLTILPPNSSYIIIDTSGINSGGDENIDYGETSSVSIILKNIGSAVSEEISLTLYENDEYIELSDSVFTFPALSPGDSLFSNDIFSFSVPFSVPDGHITNIKAAIASGALHFEDSLSFTLNSPKIIISEITIEDGRNNSLDPGETANLVLHISNSGHSPASGIKGVLNTDDPRITIKTSEQILDQLLPGEVKKMYYIVKTEFKALGGYVSPFTAHIDAECVESFEDRFYKMIGYQIENFQTGDFSVFDWHFEGDANWYIHRAYLPSGDIFYAKSGNIDDNGVSRLCLTDYVLIPGNISFLIKTSAETLNDAAVFYIDGIEIKRWQQGEMNWKLETFPVTFGEHTFEWSFEKNSSISSGSDEMMLDMITFPGIKNLPGTEIVDDVTVPGSSALIQNYPNPFNPFTVIGFRLDKTADVVLSVYNTNGALVKNLIEDKVEAGDHSVSFKSDDLISGVYIYRLNINGRFAGSKRMLLLK